MAIAFVKKTKMTNKINFLVIPEKKLKLDNFRLMKGTNQLPLQY